LQAGLWRGGQSPCHSAQGRSDLRGRAAQYQVMRARGGRGQSSPSPVKSAAQAGTFCAFFSKHPALSLTPTFPGGNMEEARLLAAPGWEVQVSRKGRVDVYHGNLPPLSSRPAIEYTPGGEPDRALSKLWRGVSDFLRRLPRRPGLSHID